MSSTLLNYSFTQDNDQIQLTEIYRVDVASGTAAQMASRSLATLGAAYAVGATRYGSTVKVWTRETNHVEGVHWDVRIYSRTESVDDLIMNSASGTVVDKGFTAETNQILRERHPTSGAEFTFGNWIVQAYSQEPNRVAWFDRVHDNFPATQTLNGVGAVNSAVFLGSTAGTWLCTSIDTNTVRTDSGQRYLARYSFKYRHETWLYKVRGYVWNSRTVTGITAATKSTGTFTLYRDYNFATWGFSF